MACKLVLQQCLSAKLEVKPATESQTAEYVEISRGMVAYICFLKLADQSTVEKLITLVTTIKLSQNDAGKLVSILELPGDLLIVPQATLGGQLKGKRMQYHQNIDKTVGSELYAKFVDGCKQNFKTSCVKTEAGTYGNLQVLNIETNGPYTHLIDIT